MSAWKTPFISNKEISACNVAIDIIIEELKNYSPTNPSLLSGEFGAILLENLFSERVNPDIRINNCITNFEKNCVLSSICSGFSGVSWGFHYLSNKGYYYIEKDN